MEFVSDKVYVRVLAEFSPEGSCRPLSITWEDGREYIIDRIIDIRKAVSLKAGGAGLRYTCLIDGERSYLFKEEGRWFVERKNA